MTNRSKKWMQWGILGAVIIGAFAYLFLIRGWEISALMKQASLRTENGMIPIYTAKEDNGATIAVVPMKELPMIDILLWFDAGSARDDQQWGISNLTARLIGEDTTQLNSQAIHDAFESVGAQFDASSSRDVFSIHLRTLSDEKALNTTVDMLTTLLKETAFKPESVAREKSRVLAAIQSKADSPAQTISDAFFMKMYDTHPYAHPATGTAETVSKITEQDLQTFYLNNVVQSRATVVVAGDITKGAGKKMADSLLAALPVGAPALPLPQPILQAASTAQINFPSTQTHLMFGLPTLAKGNPDFYAMTLGNHILGGSSLNSRLFEEVREKEGLAYNVSSQIQTLRVPGPFYVYLQTRADAAKKALDISHATLTQYMTTGPTEAEIKAAKENITGTFVLSLSSNAAIAGHVAMLGFYGLPWDYTDHFAERINAVTHQDIVTTFQKYIQPDHFTEVVLGNGP